MKASCIASVAISVALLFAIPSIAIAQITLSQSLALSPASPVENQSVTATFTAKNSGATTVTVHYFLVGARSPSNANEDFPASAPVTLAPGQSYVYTAAQSLSPAGTYVAWPAYYNGTTWIELGSRTSITVQASAPRLTVVTPLTLAPSSPAVGQPITASYTLRNDGGSDVTIRYVLVGARDATGQNVDFPSAGPITLQPGSSYTYRMSRSMSAGGIHEAWPAAYITDWTELGPHMTFSVQGSCWPAGSAKQVQYGYVPPAQTVGGGSTTQTIPAGYVHQTAWAETGGAGAADIEGVYAYEYAGWKSMVWRWADTMRQQSIQHLTSADGTAAYRVELTPGDHASPGTAGDHPRAEFFSVDPAEDRRQRQPPRENIFRDGDEYWATFAMCLPGDFPNNHRWATLIQRKFQNNMPSTYPSWFTLNVHRTTVDVALPGTPLNSAYVPVATLAEMKDRWVQVVFHEKVSSRSDGYFEIFIDGVRKASRSGPTIPAGDINFNLHYGYYRANERDDREPYPPGIGVVYYSPLMLFRGAQPSTTPMLR